MRLPTWLTISQPVVLAVGFAILMMISGISVWLLAQARQDSGQVLWTLDAKGKLLDLQGLIWRIEGDQRAFLLTGDQGYRDAFRADVEAVERALAEDEAGASGVGHAGREQLFADLHAAVAAQLTLLEEAVGQRERGEHGSPRDNALLQSRSEEIRTTIARLVQHEQQLLSEQIGASQSTAKRLLVASLVGAVLLIVLGAISVALVRRSTRQLRVAQKALEDANESLEATIAKRTAELLQANEEIQQFAHIVSHDLRSPLVNVMGFTGELEVLRKELFERLSALRGKLDVCSEPDERLAQDFDEALGFIKSSTARMDRLIKAILKLTREGRRELRLERIDMMEMVRAAAVGFSYQAQGAGASITIEPLPPCVADRLALEQIFANLLENALKYLRDDTPGRIRVTGRSTPTEVVYEVHDNGRGIEPKDRERIFEIFRRSGQQDRPGEGIGLTYVRTLVRRLGGTVSVDSVVGRGSTFTVALPQHTAGDLPERRV